MLVNKYVYTLFSHDIANISVDCCIYRYLSLSDSQEMVQREAN